MTNATPKTAEPAHALVGRVRRSEGEQGIALLVVLLLSLILIPFAGEFAWQIQLEAKTSINVTDQLLLDNAIDAQREVVLAQIEYESPNNETDSYDDDWNREEVKQTDMQMGQTVVQLSTEMFDEQGKFNLTILAEGNDETKQIWKKRLADLIRLYRRDTKFDAAPFADELADDIYKWVNGETPRGNIPRPKMIDDSRMVVLGELHFISDRFEKERLLEDLRDGDDIAPGLHRYITVYGSGKINLNTAAKPVLQAIFSLDEDVADKIIERRGGTVDPDEEPEEEEDEDPESDDGGGEPFTDVNQVNELDGVNLALLNRNKVDLARDFDVRTNVFGMWITGKTEETRRDEWIVVERVPSSDPNEGLDGFRFLLHEERTDPLEDIPADQ
ncbi:MAG: type II secretion system protein GspK [Planctomycetota bacterium]|nr:type II secretion system protein GspK [Planctomycetota bacterium]